MSPFERAPEPEILASGASRWTERWLARRHDARIALQPLPTFRWPTARKRPLNQHLEPVLMDMTAQHCAYCDAFPIRGAAVPTIDHFRPKSAFEELAFTWTNLYPACNACQRIKQEQFEAGLLRPDDPDYAFDCYFLYDHASGELRPNPGATPVDQGRADVSIRLFGLNDQGRPSMRKRAVKHARAATDEPEPLDAHPYRFAVQDVLPR